MPGATLLEVKNLTKTYPLPEGKGSVTVLQEISLSIHRGEIVALLGRSGSGKSTLLRAIAGLLPPTRGEIRSEGERIFGPNRHVAMVFQSFALLPWLTVLENVEIGQDALRITPAEMRKRALQAIQMVGLDGFENAYPKELSGGMQQRVGFSRAFVMRPSVLMLDEPFSALDVLTAENLRGEIADLWEAHTFPADSVLMVTHNIEEAVLLADRVIVLGSNPGRVRGEVTLTLSRPRDRKSREFRSMCDYIYTVMTNPEVKVSQPRLGPEFPMMPHARAGAISGLLELVEEYGGKEEVAVVGDRLRLEVDDLLPILDAAVILGLAQVEEGDVTVTPIGKEFVEADVQAAQDVFRRQVLERAPLVALMSRTLGSKRNGMVKADFFLDMLDDQFTEGEAERQFQTAVDWGRYAGLFGYDSEDEVLSVHTESAESAG